jgi:hypothetical protein
MNTMTMPGFTAEHSVYRTSGRYQLARPATKADLNAGLIQPSAAIYSGGRFVCYGEVTDSGFINCYPPGGGLSEPPDLVCGPCIRGRQRCGIPGVGFSWGPCLD